VSRALSDFNFIFSFLCPYLRVILFGEHVRDNITKEYVEKV